jgi:hypothetical protein
MPRRGSLPRTWPAFVSGCVAGASVASLIARSPKGRREQPQLGQEVKPSDEVAVAQPQEMAEPQAVVEQDILEAHRYATSRDQYPYWLDKLLAALPIRSSLGVTAMVIGVYVVGFVLAIPTGFAETYVGSLAIYLGCAGIALTLSATHIGSGAIHGVYEHLRPIFAVSDDEYLAHLDHWLNRLRSDAGHLRWAAAGAAGFLAAVYVGFFRTDLLQQYHIRSLHPKPFPPPWFTAEHMTIKAIIAGFLLLCCGIVLGSAARLLCFNLLFLLSLRKLPVIPLPSVIRVRLRPVTDLHVRSAIAWLFGVSLFGMLFYGTYDVLANSFIIVLFLIGAFTFSIPQLVFRGYLLKAYSELCTFALFSFHRRFGVRLEERWPRRIAEYTRSSFSELKSLPEMIDSTGRPGMWVYDTQDVVGWLVVQVIALIVVFAQGFLGNLT